jgi:uncharacterized repeat protein (TIGR03803 family)
MTKPKIIKNLFLLPALIVTLGLMLACRVTAQTNFTVLHTFTGSSTDGSNPLAGLIISGNTLYGVADDSGAYDSGALFAVNTNGSGYTNLYNFTDGNDGGFPDGTLILLGNTLYGTANQGGSYGNGAVFAINTNGTGFTNLYNFTGGNDGAAPNDTLLASGNNLYGTTRAGGSAGYGVVFAVNTNGAGFTNLYSFTNGIDGAQPHGLVISGNTLYGPTLGGSLFKINTDGTDFTNLHSFTAASYSVTSIGPSSLGPGFTNSDGVGTTGLILSGNTLYGTAFYGGTNGNGTVFALNTNGIGFTVLHNFAGSHANSSGTYTNREGTHPYERGLLLSGSVLYGTAALGGTNGNGTLFALNIDGTGFTNLHTFAAGTGSFPHHYTNSDGALPFDAALILSGNTLYGTAKSGGTYGGGTVFALSLPLPPTMRIITVSNKIVLSWPTNAASFTLQSITNLSSGSWSNVTSGISTVGTNYVFTNIVNGNASFFRLKQ